MSKYVLDIWAIQGIAEELPVALDNIKTDDAILFENAIIELKIGEEKIKDKIFNCVIYSEESDVMVMIMKNAKVTSDDAKQYLEAKGIKFNIVSFIEDKEKYEENVTTPEIWFARDPHVVAEACDNSINKGITNLTYSFDKSIPARLKFHFLTSAEKNKITFDGKILFQGLIKLEDKIILAVDPVFTSIEKKHRKMEAELSRKGFTEIKTDSLSIN